MLPGFIFVFFHQNYCFFLATYGPRDNKEGKKTVIWAESLIISYQLEQINVGDSQKGPLMKCLYKRPY